ncbi:MAG: TIGR01244 family sulfur transferase [Oricola sp.]
MATISQLETGIFVASQLNADDFAVIAARGFRSVVNNRPDGEAEDQIASADAQAEAQAQGLVYRHVPVANYDVTEDEIVNAQARAIAELPGPVLFYCRTGNRSTLLWAQAAVARLGLDQVDAIATRAGYDLDVLREILDERLAELAA